ncbi:hypothetical protein [Mucilaginibacter sp. SP1R1]|uniref:hypothetical protein n=1 Tax=Mucilaginibacter sp. SP1R1 TaxID=2723091 RepID=UPI001612245E|nr:hypothetical protein [Mucilaginibacter sp. SP1R1]MBB6152280.1 hypothetical protein [Mucilaginibacter sp. SP1R1]
MATLTKELQKTNISLLSLLCSANFDKSRIIIADYELSENFLTLYLEDKKYPASDLADALMYKLPVSKFAQIIEVNQLNSYSGTKYSTSGRAYADRIVIAEPINWFKQDTDSLEQQFALEVVKNQLLKSSI